MSRSAAVPPIAKAEYVHRRFRESSPRLTPLFYCLERTDRPIAMCTQSGDKKPMTINVVLTVLDFGLTGGGEGVRQEMKKTLILSDSKARTHWLHTPVHTPCALASCVRTDASSLPRELRFVNLGQNRARIHEYRQSLQATI